METVLLGSNCSLARSEAIWQAGACLVVVVVVVAICRLNLSWRSLRKNSTVGNKFPYLSTRSSQHLPGWLACKRTHTDSTRQRFHFIRGHFGKKLLQARLDQNGEARYVGLVASISLDGLQ